MRHHRIPVVQTAHEYKLACPTYRLERDGRPCFDCITGTRRNVIRNRCAGGSFSRSLAQWAEAEISAYVGDVRLVDRIICVSKRQSDLLAQAGVPKDKLGLCYNFVDTTRFAPDPGLEKGDYFLYFGRIEQLKGVEVLLDAARATGLPVKFVGHGTWTDPLQARISGIPTATYLGQQSGPALRRLVAQARAVVVPSIWEEPFGLTVAEALASGTAVIGSRIGAIPEILRDGIDGHLVAPRDSAALSRAMQAMTAEQADRMGRTARDYARSRFAPDTYISNLLNIYSELLAFTA